MIYLKFSLLYSFPLIIILQKYIIYPKKYSLRMRGPKNYKCKSWCALTQDEPCDLTRFDRRADCSPCPTINHKHIFIISPGLIGNKKYTRVRADS
jgi:hypothetical protein